MFNALRIRIHGLLIKNKKPTGFVNPYGDSIPETHPKLNPFTLSNTTKKPSSLDDITQRLRARSKPEAPYKELPLDLMDIIPKQPSFLHDMKEMFFCDLVAIANKFPKRTVVKPEYQLSSDEIRRVCESMKWQ